jgi:hypothetical protein
VSFTSPAAMDSPAVQLLLRNATDGTRVRLYERSMAAKVQCQPAGSPCPPPPACVPTSLVTAEVSDDQVAGAAMEPQWSAPSLDALQVLGAGVVGGGEPQPILVVIAHVTPVVTKVAMTTAYGTDTEVPTATGWVALAEQLPSTWTAAPNAGVPDGTVTATTATGGTAGSTSLPSVQPKNLPPGCVPPQCPMDKTSPTSTSTSAAPSTPMSPKIECGKAAGGNAGGGPATAGESGSGSVVAPARPIAP